MNCCDANGDCNQGRECPVRNQMIEERNEKLQHQYAGLLIVIASSSVAIAATYVVVHWLWRAFVP